MLPPQALSVSVLLNVFICVPPMGFSYLLWGRVHFNAPVYTPGCRSDPHCAHKQTGEMPKVKQQRRERVGMPSRFSNWISRDLFISSALLNVWPLEHEHEGSSEDFLEWILRGGAHPRPTEPETQQSTWQARKWVVVKFEKDCTSPELSSALPSRTFFFLRF